MYTGDACTVLGSPLRFRDGGCLQHRFDLFGSARRGGWKECGSAMLCVASYCSSHCFDGSIHKICTVATMNMYVNEARCDKPTTCIYHDRIFW